MTEKLSFEEWKTDSGVKMPDPQQQDNMRSALADYGINMDEQIDNALRVMYNKYLQEDNDMT